MGGLFKTTSSMSIDNQKTATNSPLKRVKTAANTQMSMQTQIFDVTASSNKENPSIDQMFSQFNNDCDFRMADSFKRPNQQSREKDSEFLMPAPKIPTFKQNPF